MLGTTTIKDTMTDFVKQINSVPLPLAKKYMKHSYYSIPKLLKEEIYEDENKICLTRRTYKLLCNTKIIPLVKTTEGITYDKNTKKLKVWIGTKFSNMPIYTLFNYLGYDWINKMSDYENYKHIVVIDLITTKTIVEKILNGKISNPKLLIKNYLKISIKYAYNWKIVRDFLNTPGIRNCISGTSLTSYLINVSKYTKNPDESLKVKMFLITFQSDIDEMIRKHTVIPDNFWDSFYIKCLKLCHVTDLQVIKNTIRNYSKLLYSTLQYSSCLDRKMNFKWSEQRLKNELNKYQNIMLDYEELIQSETNLNYEGELVMLPDSHLILNESEYFRLARYIQKDNIQTSIWEKCKRGENFAVYFDKPCKGIALINRQRDRFSLFGVITKEIDEAYGRFTHYIEEWMLLPETINFFEQNYMKDLQKDNENPNSLPLNDQLCYTSINEVDNNDF